MIKITTKISKDFFGGATTASKGCRHEKKKTTFKRVRLDEKGKKGCHSEEERQSNRSC